jgi:macrolide-specific efflux system membrane fusion protein
VLPTSAVSARGNTAVVQLKKGNQLTPTTVNIGLRGDNNVEITSGLNDGDIIEVRSTTVTAASSSGTQPRTSGAGAFGGGGAGLGGAIGGR